MDPCRAFGGRRADCGRVGEVDQAVRRPDLTGEPHRVTGLGRLGQAELAAEQRPVPGPARSGRPGRAERGDLRGEPAGEVGEVLDQGAEVELAAQGHRLELLGPVLAGQEPAGNGAEYRAAAGPALDQELIGDEPAVRGLAAAVGEPVRRARLGDLQLGRVLAEHGADGACRHLVAAHEPGVDPGPGRDRGPDLVRADRDLGLVVLRELVTHQEPASLTSASGAAVVLASGPAVVLATGPAAMLGWPATTRWYSRPPSARPSWDFATRAGT